MRVLTSKYGFLVVILMFLFIAKTGDNTNGDNCKLLNENAETKEGSKMANFFQSIIQSNNYTKYFYENSLNFIPMIGNPLIIKNVERSFLSVGQVFATCGSSVLLSLNIKDEGNKDMLSSNIQFNIGSENQDEYPAEIDSLAKGLTTSDERVFLSNMDGYPKSLTNYKSYNSKNLYKISIMAVNIKNGITNRFPFYFAIKSTKKTKIPQCKQTVKVQYTIADLITAAIIAKEVVVIKYSDFATVPISYPLLAIGVNNPAEVVASKKAITDSLGSNVFEKTQMPKILQQKLSIYKDTDAFVVSQIIVDVY